MPSSAATVTIPYPGAEVAHDFNVVVVGWNGNVQVAPNGVIDTNGNVYSLAIGPTSVPGHNSQSIYYSPNVKTGANSVTVNFTGTAAYPDIRILEYSGISTTNPIDTTAALANPITNNGTLPFTGVVTTTCPDLCRGKYGRGLNERDRRTRLYPAPLDRRRR
jgi:hypothetical protein